MLSGQLLQLTEHGRNILTSRRRTLALVAGVMVTGGTAVYMQSRITKSKRDRSKSSINVTGHLSQNGVDDKAAKILRKKRSGLRSLHILTAILLSKIGPTGLRTLVGLVTTAVLRTALSNRLARVQGFLFRSVFLRRVPLFIRLIVENLILCFLQSTLYSTSKYLTGALGLRFRKILTDLIHADYFEVIVLVSAASWIYLRDIYMLIWIIYCSSSMFQPGNNSP
ncbi:ABC transporter D family member 1-like [Dendrobium catenatum]|uniref:ABC transporter D family member 1-like n=1 Tax=Dendrobium catenatum TaxID=906689 RepID=UPI00109F6D43|nr:ABC transporter D family member 1-like [Dendrobium catenatum]